MTGSINQSNQSSKQVETDIEVVVFVLSFLFVFPSKENQECCVSYFFSLYAAALQQVQYPVSVCEVLLNCLILLLLFNFVLKYGVESQSAYLLRCPRGHLPIHQFAYLPVFPTHLLIYLFTCLCLFVYPYLYIGRS